MAIYLWQNGFWTFIDCEHFHAVEIIHFRRTASCHGQVICNMFEWMTHTGRMKSIHKYHRNNLQPNQTKSNAVLDAIEARDEHACVYLIYLANIPKSVYYLRCVIIIIIIIVVVYRKFYNAKKELFMSAIRLLLHVRPNAFQYKALILSSICHLHPRFHCAYLPCFCGSLSVFLFNFSFFDRQCCSLPPIRNSINSHRHRCEVTLKWNLTLKIHLSETQNQWK